MSNDHRLDIYVDAMTYMALKARAADQDRTISQHVRHLVREDITTALQDEPAPINGHNTEAEGD